MTNLLLTVFAALTLNSHALDNQAVLEHVRESYNLPADLQIDISEPKPSEVPGFNVVDMTLGDGGQSQTEKLYISTDGRFYQLGGFKDTRVHPDKERLKKVDVSKSAVRGNKSAAVSIVEWTDFQCYYCEKGYTTMMEVMNTYAGKVKWVYKSLPLNSIHPWAEKAAVAAECAGQQSEEKLWKLHDSLFENQKDISVRNLDDKLAEYAKTAGIALPKFQTCVKDNATLKKVRADMQEAASLGISGTPAFLVNGHLISGADSVGLKRVIEEALKGKHGSSTSLTTGGK